MDLGIEGRTALVLGASRGIGRGIATSLAREGARVAIASRTPESLAKAVAEIEGEVQAFGAETGNLEHLAGVPAEIEKRMGGPIDILVTNTGGPPHGGALDNELGEWQAAYTSLVLAPQVLISAVVPGMRARRWGRIVNVGSSATRQPIPELNLSNVHRAAAVGFFKTLAGELAADGITVNTVATGMFATERLADSDGSLDAAHEVARKTVPAGRLGNPAEYGDLVAFLCSERAAYLTGAVIPLDGGLVRSI
ncbi:MAG: SDR family oxidoreductase [Solirubrobacterales bacterium]